MNMSIYEAQESFCRAKLLLRPITCFAIYLITLDTLFLGELQHGSTLYLYRCFRRLRLPRFRKLM